MSIYEKKYLKYKTKYTNLKLISSNNLLTGSGGKMSCLLPQRGSYTTGAATPILDAMIAKIQANTLKSIAEGIKGKVYKDTIDGVIYVAKELNKENGAKEIAQYNGIKDILTRCKNLNFIETKTVGNNTYVLYLYGGDSLISWLGRNVNVDFIPILLQVGEQMKCFEADSSHLDVKAENIVVNPKDGECTDCPLCGGCEVKPGESVIAHLIDLSSLVKAGDLVKASGKQMEFTQGINDPIEMLLGRFSSKPGELSFKKRNLVGLAHTFLTCVLNSTPDAINTYKAVKEISPKIMMKILEDFATVRDELKDKLNYKNSCNRNSCDFPFTALGMWLSHSPVTLSAITDFKPEMPKDALLGIISKAGPVFRHALCDYLMKTYTTILSNKTKASHVVHIIARCCHFDEDQRYTHDELKEELYRYGKAYNGGKYTGCSGTASPKLFDAARDDYSVMPK